MVQKQIVLYTSDLSGEDLGEGGQTVTFEVEGRRYEVDLTEAEAQAFLGSFEVYIKAGRRLARNGRPYRRTTVPTVQRKTKERPMRTRSGR